MKTKTASVRCGRTVPHPLRAYANCSAEMRSSSTFSWMSSPSSNSTPSVERVQEISEADAKAEGMHCRSDLAWGGLYGTDPDTMPQWAVDHGYRYAFRELWDSLYPENSWEANPWIWVVEFERLRP